MESAADSPERPTRTADTDAQGMWVRRRRVEIGIILGRSVGIGTMLLGGSVGTLGDGMVHADIAIAAIITVMLSANVLGWIAMRGASGRRYLRLEPVLIALETVALLGFGVVAAANPDSKAWPIVLVPIIVTALRRELKATLVVWAAVSVSYIALFLCAPILYGRPLDLVTVLLVVGMGLVLAVMEGMRSQAIGRQMRALNAARKELRQQALHDPLTKLGNRTMLNEGGRRLLSSGDIAVLTFDLNGFKQVNDVHGHAAGDRLLVAVAERLSKCVRDYDLVIRLGGDEFVILLANVDEERARAVAERAATYLAMPIELDGNMITVGASIGIAMSTVENSDLDHLLKEADRMMYQAKVASQTAARVEAANR